MDGLRDTGWLGRSQPVPGSAPAPDAPALPAPYAYQVATLEFDTRALPTLPPLLHGHLTLDVAFFGESFVKVAGPFRFDFAVPVATTRRMAHIQQSVVGADSTLTLDRVIVSPSGVRAYLHFAPPDPAANTAGGERGQVLGSWAILPANRQLEGRPLAGWTHDEVITGTERPLGPSGNLESHDP